jgi:phage tail-like protein
MTTTVRTPEPAAVSKPPRSPVKPLVVPDLPGPTSLAHGLPAIFRDPDAVLGDPTGSFVRSFIEALDEVLEPVFAALDNLPACFDPPVAPEHFLDWLAGWVALELYEKWPPKLRRKLIAGAVDRHHERGTKRGLEETVRIFTDAKHVTVEESGGVWALAKPALDRGGAPRFPRGVPRGSRMKITVAIGDERLSRPHEVDDVTELVLRVAERVKPAHVVLLPRDVAVVA